MKVHLPDIQDVPSLEKLLSGILSTSPAFQVGSENLTKEEDAVFRGEMPCT